MWVTARKLGKGIHPVTITTPLEVLSRYRQSTKFELQRDDRRVQVYCKPQQPRTKYARVLTDPWVRYLSKKSYGCT